VTRAALEILESSRVRRRNDEEDDDSDDDDTHDPTYGYDELMGSELDDAP
jgi:hypothetical protein